MQGWSVMKAAWPDRIELIMALEANIICRICYMYALHMWRLGWMELGSDPSRLKLPEAGRDQCSYKDR